MTSITTLPEPSFIERDPAVILRDLVQTYESAAGRTLYPAQPERLMVDLIAYRELLVRQGIQDAAKQCLVRYARFPMLDLLGELLGVSRLPAQPALTTLQVTLTALQGAPTVIPAGSLRIGSKDGAAVFATTADLVIAAGQFTGTVESQAETAGAEANGYLPGEVASILTPRPLVATVANVGTTAGGLPGEDDEHLRGRVLEAPEKFSVAGPFGAYRWFSMSAHPGIVDVGILSQAPGVVHVHPLMGTGLPSAEILALVSAAVNDEKVRPLCDAVQVLAPVRVTYPLAVGVTARRGADLQAVLDAVQTAAEAFAEGRRQRLGLDLVQAQVVAAIMVPGVYSVELTGWADRVLTASEWADCVGVSVVLSGVADD